MCMFINGLQYTWIGLIHLSIYAAISILPKFLWWYWYVKRSHTILCSICSLNSLKGPMGYCGNAVAHSECIRRNWEEILILKNHKNVLPKVQIKYVGGPVRSFTYFCSGCLETYQKKSNISFSQLEFENNSHGCKFCSVSDIFATYLVNILYLKAIL